MIAKTANGRWRVRVKSKGVVVADQTFDRKGDAQTWEQLQKRSLALGTFVDPRHGRRSLGELADAWLTDREGSVAAKTFQTDEYLLRVHLSPEVRKLPIAVIGASELGKLFGRVSAATSHATVKRFRATLSSVFSWAVRERWLQANPVMAVQLPKGTGVVDKREVNPFTLEEVFAVYDQLRLKNEPAAEVALILALTGLRWGELVAIRVRDVQLVPVPCFRVARSAPDGMPVRSSTKGGGTRTVPLNTVVLPIVQQRMAGRDPDDLLFTSTLGQRLNGKNWARSVAWKSHCRGRRIHDLRHTAATIWLGQNIDPKTVQAWLGHESMTLTVDLYGHYMGSDADNAALERMNTALRGRVGDAGTKSVSV